MNAVQFSICIVLVCIAAFLSGSEVALFSLTRFQLRIIKEKYKNVHRKIRELLSDPPGLLLSILLTNEVVNVTLSAIIAENVTHRWGNHEDWILQLIEGLLITTPIVLLLCEMTPKALGSKLNFLVAPLVTHPLHFLYRMSKPLRWILFPNRDAVPANSEKERTIIQEDEFITLVEQGHQEGSIEKSELELIKNVFDLDDTPVSEILIPMTQTHCLQSQATLKESLGFILNSPYSRIPVLNNKEITGILYKKDLLLDPEFQSHDNQLISEWMRSPLEITSDMQINTVFRQLRQTKTHMAVVKDPITQKTLGIVTMKDVLTELFEDILA